MLILLPVLETTGNAQVTWPFRPILCPLQGISKGANTDFVTDNNGCGDI